jgi:hypothetical protein
MSMNTSFRRATLAVTLLLGLYVGVWAAFLPRTFFDGFPGFGLHWIDLDGAFDEHLIRDVGFAYLALSSLSLAGVLARTALPGRLAGLGWTVFGVLHFGYHLLHLEGSVIDRLGNIVSLGLSLVLGILLLPRSRREDRTVRMPTETEAAR